MKTVYNVFGWASVVSGSIVIAGFSLMSEGDLRKHGRSQSRSQCVANGMGAVIRGALLINAAKRF